ncbi:hypothetical protein HMP09_0512 [Sphingomonas sp. HMP9]|uniref:hypothetical protein n=1 Tax=Sphingomonas sp. HMP9 TaxID=1517554 RepID=UPI00159A2D15|nr:hypothetical protein HMP09_0512 [Sphingomonas sp. HMP9]
MKVPENAHTPIAARLTLASGGATISVDFDFREEGEQIWTIAVETAGGLSLRLSNGAAALSIDGGPACWTSAKDYPALYAHFAKSITAGAIDADPAPLCLVADALLVTHTERVEAFVE